MNRKGFSMVFNETERAMLEVIATHEGQKLGATIRLVLRDAARERGLWPPKPAVEHQPERAG